jgi:N-acyl-D-aspartate/D-glutamate deacylase
MLDLVIRGGTVVDGTGAAARTADVGVDGGRIVGVGRLEGPARRVIDADGALVTPGFVDIHTHYDGQATWDDRLQPSSGQGVTTVVMGNCGVGFAPVRPSDHDQLIELMEGVEDLPGTVLHEGLTWEWQSFCQYLDAVEARPHDVDCAAQVVHGPLRLYVMGQRGADREPAGEEEIAEMGRLAAEAVAAGALGFSTSRTLNHRTSRGEPTPTLTAAREELVGIAAAVGRTGTGVLQVITDFPDFDHEMGTLREMVRASGRPLSVSLAQAGPGDGWRRTLDEITRANAEGLPMRAQVGARAIGAVVTLEGSVCPWRRSETFRSGADLSDPRTKESVLAEVAAAGGLRLPFDRLFELGDPPDYEPEPSRSVAARAERDGRAPEDLLYDLLMGGAVYLPVLNYFDGNLDAVGEMLAHPHTVPGLGDGGAHVGTICDASFPTTLLSYWARDRRRGRRFGVEEVVARQCRSTALAVGLADRGVLAEGYKADLNVIDFDHLRLGPPRVVADLPAGGRRLTQTAHGYLHTIVSGVEVYAGGEATGALPGRLVRGAQPCP